ncbi:MAG: hypothetical protein IJM82_06500 [Synergistaceae bacterium]|nr:hypothetical protein [Synergistaceae bacterium]MBQ6738935.1 hypothetical protein [Synergistaceae bacterium]MBQ7068797.1 hypothetical protein [Synergistaceae bacterium]MBR0079689.1 hypothetical protein [Synergistaceae bacterium]MBR0232606.1 hypothetical protein [Synergistaceae bacterium]
MEARDEKLTEVEEIDWGRAPADTPVCIEKEIYLRDIVQSILDGYETAEDVMDVLSLTKEDKGVSEIPKILDIFVPVINAWRSGSCGMGCAGCTGHCGG